MNASSIPSPVIVLASLHRQALLLSFFKLICFISLFFSKSVESVLFAIISKGRRVWYGGPGKVWMADFRVSNPDSSGFILYTRGGTSVGH